MVRESPDLHPPRNRGRARAHGSTFRRQPDSFGTDPALLDEELAACFESKAHSLCFFWDVRPDLIQRARAAGCKVLYQVGRLTDAVAAATAGADVIICQGVEAGGMCMARYRRWSCCRR